MRSAQLLRTWPRPILLTAVVVLVLSELVELVVAVAVVHAESLVTTIRIAIVMAAIVVRLRLLAIADLIEVVRPAMLTAIDVVLRALERIVAGIRWAVGIGSVRRGFHFALTTSVHFAIDVDLLAASLLGQAVLFQLTIHAARLSTPRAHRRPVALMRHLHQFASYAARVVGRYRRRCNALAIDAVAVTIHRSSAICRRHWAVAVGQRRRRWLNGGIGHLKGACFGEDKRWRAWRRRMVFAIGFVRHIVGRFVGRIVIIVVGHQRLGGESVELGRLR